ncbi:FtsL-like putative cell division protein [Pseudomonadota bacterium]|nr:FtsL-like putative cell division protein [Pseudomonadota bacterium]
MIRYPSFLFVFFIIFVAISLYQIKHSISKKEMEITKINKDIIQTKSNLYILKAELSYLKRPDRIERIALTKLKMRPVLPIDIWNLEDLVGSKVSKHKEGL